MPPFCVQTTDGVLYFGKFLVIMVEDNDSYNMARRAVKDIFHDASKNIIKIVFYFFIFVIGLNIMASSSNIPNIILMIIGIFLGGGISVLSVWKIYSNIRSITNLR